MCVGVVCSTVRRLLVRNLQLCLSNVIIIIIGINIIIIIIKYIISRSISSITATVVSGTLLILPDFSRFGQQSFSCELLRLFCARIEILSVKQ